MWKVVLCSGERLLLAGLLLGNTILAPNSSLIKDVRKVLKPGALAFCCKLSRYLQAFKHVELTRT